MPTKINGSTGIDKIQDGVSNDEILSKYDKENILGVVSQVGGIPTGAVIERGSNANGEYVRFADGTQICHFDGTDPSPATTADGAIFRSNSPYTWTFPAGFSVGSHLYTGASGQSSQSRWFTCRVATTTTAEIARYSTFSDTGTRTFRAVAIGRWF